MERMKRHAKVKELRKQLAALPYVCRAGMVKMFWLKQNTDQLKMTATQTFGFFKPPK